jgi:hypothetical protein
MSKSYEVSETLDGTAFGGHHKFFDEFGKALAFSLSEPTKTGGANGWAIFYSGGDGFPRGRMRMIEPTPVASDVPILTKYLKDYKCETVGDSFWVAAPQSVIRQAMDSPREHVAHGRHPLPEIKLVKVKGKKEAYVLVTFRGLKYETPIMDYYWAKSEFDEAKGAFRAAIGKKFDEEAVSCVSKIGGEGKIHVEVSADGNVFSAAVYDRSHPYADQKAREAIGALKKIILAARQQTPWPSHKYVE